MKMKMGERERENGGERNRVRKKRRDLIFSL